MVETCENYFQDLKMRHCCSFAHAARQHRPTHSCPPFQHLLSERLTSLDIMGKPRVPPLCQETSVSRTANVGTVGKNWLRNRNGGQKWVNCVCIFAFRTTTQSLSTAWPDKNLHRFESQISQNSSTTSYK